MIPHTTPDEADRREAMGMHISECDWQACSGFLGDYDTYLCICWCHRKKSPGFLTGK